jgi:putative methyltransferase (TIGR04325 family)
MNTDRLRKLLKSLTPPLLLRLIRQIDKYGFSGNYTSWEAAKKDTAGYDSHEILSKVKSSLLQVKQGETVFERDSVLFNSIQYSFPILATLLKISLENQGKLSILDFGGSLGSSYYQYKNILSSVNNLKWSIVEQSHFVECGKHYFEDDHLKFFDSIDSCLTSEKPDIILLSSVVQYLEFPYQFLQQLMSYDFKNIIFDRTAFVVNGSDRLTIQKISPEIYSASYPAWFLDINKFKSILLEKYDLVFEFDSLDVVNIPSKFKGFYFQHKLIFN